MEGENQAIAAGSWLATLYIDPGKRSRMIVGKGLRMYTNKRVILEDRAQPSPPPSKQLDTIHFP